MVSFTGRSLVLKQIVHRTPKRGEETLYIRVTIVDTRLVPIRRVKVVSILYHQIMITKFIKNLISV